MLVAVAANLTFVSSAFLAGIVLLRLALADASRATGTGSDGPCPDSADRSEDTTGEESAGLSHTSSMTIPPGADRLDDAPAHVIENVSRKVFGR